MSELVLYASEDGKTRIHLHQSHGQLWLNQAEIAELFQTTVSNINKHIKDIQSSGEQDESTIEYYSIVQNEGGRQVTRSLNKKPDMSGFSARNLKYMRKFAQPWPDSETVQRTVAQIAWGVNLTLLDKLNAPQEKFYGVTL